MKPYSRIIIVTAGLLALVTFTPIVMPYHQPNPKLWGLPYSLWTSMAISILLIVLTYLFSRVPSNTDQDDS